MVSTYIKIKIVLLLEAFQTLFLIDILNRHSTKILPTNYPSADLSSLFIRHFTNKVDKHIANIASEQVKSTLVTGTTTATFSSFEKVSQLTVKECILHPTRKSCDLYPIPSKLLIECLDFIPPSLNDPFNSSLASGIFPQHIKSALVTPITWCYKFYQIDYISIRTDAELFISLKKITYISLFNYYFYVVFESTLQYYTIGFVEHQNRAITARMRLQIPKV